MKKIIGISVVAFVIIAIIASVALTSNNNTSINTETQPTTYKAEISTTQKVYEITLSDKQVKNFEDKIKESIYDEYLTYVYSNKWPYFYSVTIGFDGYLNSNEYFTFAKKVVNTLPDIQDTFGLIYPICITIEFTNNKKCTKSIIWTTNDYGDSGTITYKNITNKDYDSLPVSINQLNDTLFVISTQKD